MKKSKLYSPRAIDLGTFLGGPLVAGYLISKNYQFFNQPDKARNALLYGIGTFILLISLLFVIPDSIVNNIPQPVLPIVITFIVRYIVKNSQGVWLDNHARAGGNFYSIWRTVAIGLSMAIFYVILLFSYVFASGGDMNSIVFNAKEYDEKFEVFFANEKSALSTIQKIGTVENEIIIQELENAVNRWYKNEEIIEEVRKMRGLTNDLKKRNDLLFEYCELRLEECEIVRKCIESRGYVTDMDLFETYNKIEKLLESL